MAPDLNLRYGQQGQYNPGNWVSPPTSQGLNLNAVTQVRSAFHHAYLFNGDTATCSVLPAA
jgi:hypothetical protein